MKIYVRSAKFNDAKLLIKIHNSSIKGGYFKSKNLINLKSHLEWLKKKLRSSSRIYIGRNSENKNFGYVRFDEIKNKIFEVSIANLPNFYGKGLGSLMLDKSIKKFKKKNKIKKITSVVKKNNYRSLKCFLNNNFVKTKFDKNKHFTKDKIDTKKEDYLELKSTLE